MAHVTGNTRSFRLPLVSKGAHSNYSLPVSLEVTHAKTVKTIPLSLQIKNNDKAEVGKCLIGEKQLILRYWKGKSLKVRLAWEQTQLGPEGKQPGSLVPHHEEPADPLGLPPSLHPARLPVLSSQRHPAAQHPGPPDSRQAQPAPAGTCRNVFHTDNAPWSLTLTRSPPEQEERVWGGLKARVWKQSRRTGELANSSGAFPSPSQPAAPHGPPGRALLLRLAGCRLGEQVARSLPFPFHPGRSCAWARKVRKQRTDLLPGLLRSSSRCGRGCRRDAGGPAAVPHQLRIDLPAGSLFYFFSPSSLHPFFPGGDKKKRGVGVV